jgi:hypothetical protein
MQVLTAPVSIVVDMVRDEQKRCVGFVCCATDQKKKIWSRRINPQPKSAAICRSFFGVASGSYDEKYYAWRERLTSYPRHYDSPLCHFDRGQYHSIVRRRQKIVCFF